MAQQLLTMGFTEVYALKGGFQEWVEAGYPLEKKAAERENCIACHTQITPKVVQDWKTSRHAEPINAVSCSVCHGSEHSEATDVDEAGIVTAKRCRFCHQKQWESFSSGKHALAWESMQTFPDYHWRSPERPDSLGMCKECHKVGLKPAAETVRLSRELGLNGANSCANCHTPHAFSGESARSPEVCRSCHTGSETPQWETYTASRHWEIGHRTRQATGRFLGATCQICHLPDGSHAAGTAWGSTFLRLPWPDDRDWALARKDILTALRAFNPETGSRQLLESYFRLRVFPVTDAVWKEKRQAMLQTCTGCHAEGFAQPRLQQADTAIRESDILLARGMNILAGLYAGGLLEPPSHGQSYPNLIRFPPNRHFVEKELGGMFRVHRKQALSGSFHAPGTEAPEQGLQAMEGSLGEIERTARRMRSGR